jgi:hypothetical protein
MFSTIGHTFELIKTSWGVLMKDKELLWFPVFSAIGVGIVIAVFLGLAAATGTLDRLSETSTAADGETASQSFKAIDAVLVVVAFYSVYFVTIFFNAALVAGAIERLRGGDPNVSSALGKALSHIHSILGWALITGTVGLVLQLARGRSNNGFARILLDIVGGVWAFLTFFVVPVIVAEGLGPVAAIKRSMSLVRQTWGRQITANFGFMIVYIIAILIAVLPAILIGLIVPIAGVVVGFITVAIAMAVVQALEGVFKAALYEYALGERPQEFDLRTLQTAYRPV